MKQRNLFILAAGVLVTLTTKVHAEISFGLKTNVTNSNIFVRDQRVVIRDHYIDYNLGNSISYSVGMFIDVSVMKNLSLEAELMNLRKGSRESHDYELTTPENPNGNGEVLTVTYEIGLEYVSLGMNVKPKLDIGDVSVYGTFGPTVNLMTGATNFTQQHLKKTLVGYNAGVGLEFKSLARTPIRFEIRYNSDVSEFNTDNNGNLWNRTIIFGIGVCI